MQVRTVPKGTIGVGHMKPTKSSDGQSVRNNVADTVDALLRSERWRAVRAVASDDIRLAVVKATLADLIELEDDDHAKMRSFSVAQEYLREGLLYAHQRGMI